MSKLEQKNRNKIEEGNSDKTDKYFFEDNHNFNSFENCDSQKKLIKEKTETENLDRAFISELDSLKNENSQFVLSFNNENSFGKN